MVAGDDGISSLYALTGRTDWKGEIRSFADVKQYRRKKRWLS